MSKSNGAPKTLIIVLPVNEFRSVPFPGVDQKGRPNRHKLGTCFVQVTALPASLTEWLQVNPRSPKVTKTKKLTGVIPRKIRETLLDAPRSMALRNQGIDLLVDSAEWTKKPGGAGELTLTLRDPNRHGIINGGHTFATILEVVDEVQGVEIAEGVVDGSGLDQAYVKLRVYQGVEEAEIPDIAEGLNRSKQVDDPSLDNLRAHFESLKNAMKGQPGEDMIAYFDGDDTPDERKPLYVRDLVSIIELFNVARWDTHNHPSYIMNRLKTGEEFYVSDLQLQPSPIELILPKVPDILRLRDLLKVKIPGGYSRAKPKVKSDTKAKIRTLRYGDIKEKDHGKPLSASGEILYFLRDQDKKLPGVTCKAGVCTTAYRVPRWILFPVLAAFRANVHWDLNRGRFDWIVPLDELIDPMLDECMDTFVQEVAEGGQKDAIGNDRKVYDVCYKAVRLLADKHRRTEVTPTTTKRRAAKTRVSRKAAA